MVVVAYQGNTGAPDIGQGHIYVLDGETGAVNYRIDQLVANRATPEIVTVELEFVDVDPYVLGRLVAFEHDGGVAWKSSDQLEGWCSPSLADVDNDGDVETLCKSLYDHEGNALLDDSNYASVMLDLDGDGDGDLW